MRALIDTCIIIDVLQNRQPFCKHSQEVFLACANNMFNGYITAKAVTDIYYLTHRATHSDKSAREVLNKLFALFDILDTAGIDCRKAVPSEMHDFEDAVMVETAMRSEVDCIVTRNAEDFAKSPIPVYIPEKFVQKLNEE